MLIVTVITEITKAAIIRPSFFLSSCADSLNAQRDTGVPTNGMTHVKRDTSDTAKARTRFDLPSTITGSSESENIRLSMHTSCCKNHAVFKAVR